MTTSRIQWSISIIAALVAIVHVIWPTLSIDSITISLVIIAMAPWLAPLFKKLKFPGGVEIEFRDLLQTTERAGKAGLLTSPQLNITKPEYSFQIIGNDDPNLALAGLRIEIEKRLRNIADKIGVPSTRQSVGMLLNILTKQNILTQEQRSVLSDMVGLLNNAVHGASAPTDAIDWAMDTGPRLLQTLDDILAR